MFVNTDKYTFCPRFRSDTVMFIIKKNLMYPQTLNNANDLDIGVVNDNRRTRQRENISGSFKKAVVPPLPFVFTHRLLNKENRCCRYSRTKRISILFA